MAGNKLNLGRKASKETRLKMSESHMGEKNHFYGKHHTEETKQKLRIKNSGKNSSWWGKKHSEKTLKEMSEIKFGDKNPLWNKEHTEENRRRWSNGIQGKDNPNWKGGITPENRKIRTSLEMEEWRKSVFTRDCYICVRCLNHDGKLHAHHILSFADFSEERFELDNGATLCIDCHHYVHSNELRSMEE